MDTEEYYTKRREESKAESELVVDGDRKTVDGVAWDRVTLKSMRDRQLYLDFGMDN